MSKVRENMLRRMADRQGLRLVKSRSRDPNAVDFGLYALIDLDTGGAVNPALINRWVCSWTIDEVEEYLAPPKKKRNTVTVNVSQRTREIRAPHAVRGQQTMEIRAPYIVRQK